MATIRKQKIVSVCSIVDERSDQQHINYTTLIQSSPKTKLYTQVKVPKNSCNLLLLEVYPEFKVNEDASHSALPCKVNFMSLCCEKDAIADDILYNFDENYRCVDTVDFSGHIGSMRFAFDLLIKFEKCKDVVFVITDQNTQFPHGTKETFFDGTRKYPTVERVKIIHDTSKVDKNMEEIQTSTWRLDEILDGCSECFPNLKKFEVSIYPCGANFDKIKAFVRNHPLLNNRYTVEINEKVKTRPNQQPSSSYQKAIAMPSTSSVSCGLQAKAQGTLTDPITIDIDNVKEEVTEEEMRSIRLEKEFVPSTASQGLSRSSRFTDYGNNGPSHHSIPPTGQNGNDLTMFYAPGENKGITYKGDADTTFDLRHQHLSQSEPHSSRSVSGTEYMTSPVQGTHQRLVPHESSDSRLSEVSERENARLQFARNPSPPPMTERQLATNSQSQTSSTENYGNNEINQVYESESRRRVPPLPPVISEVSGSLVAYSEDVEQSQEHLHEHNTSTIRSRSQVDRLRDRRLQQTSSSYSSSPHQRDFNRSRTHRRIHPPSHSRSPQRYSSRSQSRSPRRKYSKSQSRREYSRSPSRTASPSPNSRKSHRHHHSERKRFVPNSRKSRIQSSSVSSRSDSTYKNRSAGQSNYRGDWKGQYNPAVRRARGRGIRGERFRGRGRGGGNRWYCSSASQYYVPHRQECENWEDDNEDQDDANCDNKETERYGQT